MARLKYNHKFLSKEEILAKSSDSNLMHEIHQQMIPHIEQQAREEARKAVLTGILMDQVIVGGPSIIGQDEVYVCIDYAKQKPKQNQDNHEINPEEEMQ
jgi:hypothetical protein